MNAHLHALHPALPKFIEAHTEVSMSQDTANRSWTLPLLGDNPSTEKQGTTPGAFANRGRVGTPWTFSSPDTAGMPQPSELTAMDFRDANRDCDHKTQLEA